MRDVAFCCLSLHSIIWIDAMTRLGKEMAFGKGQSFGRFVRRMLRSGNNRDVVADHIKWAVPVHRYRKWFIDQTGRPKIRLTGEWRWATTSGGRINSYAWIPFRVVNFSVSIRILLLNWLTLATLLGRESPKVWSRSLYLFASFQSSLRSLALTWSR